MGCMRVFMTLSCNSPVRVDRRCSGVAKAESSRLRLICRSWLRVSTISETRVIRPSSTSTETRIDWVVAMPCGSSPIGGGGSSLLATGAGAGLAATGAGAGSAALATGSSSLAAFLPFLGLSSTTGSGSSSIQSGPSAAANAASRSASETSPGRRARPVEGSMSPTPSAGATRATGSGSEAIGRSGTSTAWTELRSTSWPSAMASSCAIRSLSSPSGSEPVVSRPFRISLMRSIECRTRVTATGVTSSLPSRKRPSRVSPAWATASRRDRPRKPHVPFTV